MASANLSSEAQAMLELKHIQLEIDHGRAQHMRHFVDQYYCYKHGFVNRNGRAKWQGIFWSGLVSSAARAAKPDTKMVVKEHVVPLKVITGRLLDLGQDERSVSLESIASVLDALVQFATITKDEDRLLKDAKLSQSMPEGFWTEGHPYYQDIMARYKEVGIEVEECR